MQMATFRLFERGQVDPSANYLTLRYFRGDGKFLILDTSNYEALWSGMPGAALPQAFQDAIAAVLRFSKQYIWIDSLCIIQRGDNNAGWSRKAPAMNQVYTKAFCNISTTGASDSAGRLFSRRNSVAVPTIYLKLNIDCVLSDNSRVWLNEVLRTRINLRG